MRLRSARATACTLILAVSATHPSPAAARPSAAAPSASNGVPDAGAGRAPAGVILAIRAAARRYGLDPRGMIRVAACESRLDPLAVNGQYLGLFQLGAAARERFLQGDWRDAHANAEAAARYARAAGGFSPWTCGFDY